MCDRGAFRTLDRPPGLGSFSLGLLSQAKGLNHRTYTQHHRRFKQGWNRLAMTMGRVGADSTQFLLVGLEDVATNSGGLSKEEGALHFLIVLKGFKLERRG